MPEPAPPHTDIFSVPVPRALTAMTRSKIHGSYKQVRSEIIAISYYYCHLFNYITLQC